MTTEARLQYWKDPFNKGTGKTGQSHVKKKWNYSLTPYKKISSKWIKDLNVRPDTIKLLEENIGKTLADLNHSSIFFDSSPRIMEIKNKQMRPT